MAGMAPWIGDSRKPSPGSSILEVDQKQTGIRGIFCPGSHTVSVVVLSIPLINLQQNGLQRRPPLSSGGRVV